MFHQTQITALICVKLMGTQNLKTLERKVIRTLKTVDAAVAEVFRKGKEQDEVVSG